MQDNLPDLEDIREERVYGSSHTIYRESEEFVASIVMLCNIRKCMDEPRDELERVAREDFKELKRKEAVKNS